jgi:hypothetical protein
MSISQNFPNVAENFNINFAEAKRLDSRITFTRNQSSSTGSTYLGDNGLIKYAAANEPRFDHQPIVRTNVFLNSENMSDSYYTFYAQDVTVVTNTANAPNGTLTADLVREGTANSAHQIRPVVATDRSAFRAISIYAKASGRSRMVIQDNSYNNNYFNATYDLNTGTVVSTFTSGTSTLTSASMVPVADGWYRCVLVGRPNNSFGGNSEISFSLSDGTSTSYTGNGSSGILMWGAQFEVGNSVSDYISTTSVPLTRTTIKSLGLLMEEPRTNLFAFSEQLDLWSIERCTITTNNTVAPDGSLTADRVNETTDNNSHQIFRGFTVTSSSITFSIFAKAGTIDKFVLSSFEGNTPANPVIAVFNLSTETATLTNGSSASIIKYPNGWYRCSVSATNAANVFTNFIVRLINNSYQETYTGSTSNNIFFWGAQVENSASVSSYIPALSSSVSRVQDLASISGRGFTSMYNQYEGTIKIEGILNDTLRNPTRFGGLIAAGNGTSGFNGLFYNPFRTTGYYCSNDQQTPSVQLDRTYTVGVPYKIAASYNLTDFSCVLNGGTAITSVNNPGRLLTSHKYFQVGGNAINQNTQGLQTISSISYYSRKLTDLEMQTITR